MAHHGMIRWYVQGGLTMLLTKNDRDKGIKIEFGLGNGEEDEFCKLLLQLFVKSYGGRDTDQDPEYLKCADVVRALWEAGKNLYGPPLATLVKDFEDERPSEHEISPREEPQGEDGR